MLAISQYYKHVGIVTLNKAAVSLHFHQKNISMLQKLIDSVEVASNSRLAVPFYRSLQVFLFKSLLSNTMTKSIEIAYDYNQRINYWSKQKCHF